MLDSVLRCGRRGSATCHIVNQPDYATRCRSGRGTWPQVVGSINSVAVGGESDSDCGQPIDCR
jgi:hypothetical protein